MAKDSISIFNSLNETPENTGSINDSAKTLRYTRPDFFGSPRAAKGISASGPNKIPGTLQSPNYRTGASGWIIRESGDVEFNNGVFRGDFNIGGLQLTINDVSEIQPSIDLVYSSGGGIVYLQDGTYVLESDINIPSGVTLSGVNRDGTILDCDTDFSVNMQGDFVYDTGTVTISPGDTEVVGSGTTFTASMVGNRILLGSNGYYYWYEISAFTDATHIDIGSSYFGPAIAGADYVIADIVVHPVIQLLTITNAGSDGLIVQYALEPQLNDIVVFGCDIGIGMSETVYPRIVVTSAENGINWFGSRVSGFKVDFSDFSNSVSGDNVELELCGDATFFDSVTNTSSGSGIKLTTCTGIAFLSVTANSNTEHGVEMVSGCSGNQFTDCGISENGIDGISMAATTDSSNIKGCSIDDNTVYGIDIEAASCDENIIGLNHFSGNGTASVNDSGTDTLIRSNIGVADN